MPHSDKGRTDMRDSNSTPLGRATKPQNTERAIEPKKVTVTFAADTYNSLADIADKWGISMSEALRRAIGLLSFYAEVQQQGNDLLVRDRNTRELDRVKVL